MALLQRWTRGIWKELETLAHIPTFRWSDENPTAEKKQVTWLNTLPELAPWIRYEEILLHL